VLPSSSASAHESANSTRLRRAGCVIVVVVVVAMLRLILSRSHAYAHVHAAVGLFHERKRTGLDVNFKVLGSVTDVRETRNAASSISFCNHMAVELYHCTSW